MESKLRFVFYELAGSAAKTATLIAVILLLVLAAYLATPAFGAKRSTQAPEICPQVDRKLDIAQSQNGCPFCCCQIRHPAGLGAHANLGYCLRSDQSECKTMCEAVLIENVAALSVDEIERLLQARVPGIKFKGNHVEMDEGAARALVLMIHERDMVMETK